MFRATTPLHTFIFNVNPDETFKRILISYAQNGNVILEKEKDDLTFEAKEETWEASLRLTQEETNLFNAKARAVTVQVRALTYEDSAVAFEKQNIPLIDVLNDEVLA